MLREVEDSLIAYSREKQRKQSLAESVDANRLALELANERYQKGLTGFLDVLISQRALLQAQNELIISQAQSSQHLIAIYKGFGQRLGKPTRRDGLRFYGPSKSARKFPVTGA